MTEATTAVDTPRTVMWSISDIASRDGVSKQSVSKKVADLIERQGLSVERDERGRVSRVNVAEYDHLRGRTDNPSKSQRPSTSGRELSQSESYEEALRQKTWHEAERRRLELESLKGALVPLADITVALGEVAGDIIQVLDRLPALADDLAAAIAREGSHGARTILKAEVERLRTGIADALDKALKPPSETA
ncbi:ArsR family transcriptional regulator [Labrys portucalensis]|uniref:ArsR family transcriptional regulator n=1 Tax=Labrys neptuniae TaxID=376174 RepID=A0ABV6ZJZ6_9HYPH